MSALSVIDFENDSISGVILPLELWEIILKKLHNQDLLQAAIVCCRWRHLAKRICRERCQRLPSRLILELTDEYYASHIPSPTPTSTSRSSLTPSEGQTDNQSENNLRVNIDMDSKDSCAEPDSASLTQSVEEKMWMSDMESVERPEPDWLIITRMILQTAVTPEPENCNILHQMEQVIYLAVASNFVVAVSRGKVEDTCFLRLVDVSGDEVCTLQVMERIHKVCILQVPSMPALVAVCIDKELACYLPEPHDHTMSALSLSQPIFTDCRMCCEGSTVVVAERAGQHQLALYEALPYLDQHTLDLTLKARVITSSAPIYWDFWSGFITAVLSGGHVSTYTQEGVLVAESPLYKDLRYPNPTVLTRGLILASTITSRTLLSYWHMDRDRDYWLIGESVLGSWVERGQAAVGNTSMTTRRQVDNLGLSDTNQKLPEDFIPTNIEPSSVCITTLAKIRVGSAVMLEATALHYKRGLLFCGTSQGHLLVYKIFEDKPNGKINWSLTENFPPFLHLSVMSRPISRVVAFFRNCEIIVGIGNRDRLCHILSLPNQITCQ